MSSQPGSQRPLAPGTVLGQGRYRIGELMARGGMGGVYRGWDLLLRAPVAVKEMWLPDDALESERPAFYAQFRQEAQAINQLAHPNLVRLTDFFQEKNNPYLVMEFVKGSNLQKLVEEQGPLPEEKVVEWMAQLLDALEYCHGVGILHRGIKPQNLIVQEDDTIVLVGFGLTKTWSPASRIHTVWVIRGMGTPGYAPPEQYGKSELHTDPRSDLYSVGATTYYCLTGQVPADPPQRRASSRQLKPVRSLNPQVSEQVEDVIRQAMELDPDRRFSNAREMQEALTARHPPPPAQPARTGLGRVLQRMAGRGKRGQPAAPVIDKSRLAFISYSSQDRAFVRRLREQLTQHVLVWWDGDIPKGAPYSSAIHEALTKCTCLLVILSPNSAHSSEVEAEWRYALDHDKHVLPILYRNCDVPYRLSVLQYIDFTSRGPTDKAAVQEVLENLR